ncbi:LytR/AlgR family response regulator transcription factor [Thiorhodovibrio frisius]|uniref:Response regulator of the LytR/AlgR family n=1 Tax=Thiorhodovibrio frisius TaxID=631362 RepID=H8Z6C3_9GAMM|nr:LytTR family DNA-binding domain-containing protein [Thiorhodovibrio frisius]EIC20707.1 response regulator of the LytR/AlgR family [Thiorhodovibrio frisius]WPL21455.1 Transcriptional regulatory protein YpdB [Thiorhodovibrio frisius]
MKILLVDDEAHARERLRRLIAEFNGDYQIVAEADNGADAVRRCSEASADLVLLDIRMPGMDGLSVAEHLAQLSPPPAVILITAYPEYALEAFEHQVANYLVKPVRAERLREALERLHVVTRPQQQMADEDAPAWPRRHLSAQYRGGVQRVAIEDILFLQAEQKYVTVYHGGGKMLLDESLKTLEEEFPERFLRIHRSILVCARRLIGLEKSPQGGILAVLDGSDQRLPVSRRHLPSVRRFLRAS